MKVAYLLGSLSRGGTETLVLDVFKRYKDVPYEFIGVHRKGGAYMDDFYSAGPKFIHCRQGKNIFSYLWRLRKVLLSEKVTICHAQQFIDCIYAKLATIGTGIKVIETFHGYDYGAGSINKKLIALSIRFADKLIFVSNAERDYYVKEYGIDDENKITVVYNGINFDKIDNYGQLSESLPNSKGTTVKIAMVGNFVRGRNQLELCKILKLLHDSSTQFDFYFVGRRDENQAWRYDNCVEYCKANGLDEVHFLGARSDVPAILHAIDIFAYSTDHDTFGIAVAEAMAAGVPVLVNDYVVMQEITDNGNLATLYKTGNHTDGAKKLKSIIDNLATYKSKALANAPKVRAKYSIENHIAALNGVYGG